MNQKLLSKKELKEDVEEGKNRVEAEEKKKKVKKEKETSKMRKERGQWESESAKDKRQ